MQALAGWDIAGWASAIAAFLTACGVIWRTVIRPIIRWARRVEGALGFVEHEMRENSGKSMRDAVNRIDKRIEKVEQRVSELAPQTITVVTQGDTT